MSDSDEMQTNDLGCNRLITEEMSPELYHKAYRFVRAFLLFVTTNSEAAYQFGPGHNLFEMACEFMLEHHKQDFKEITSAKILKLLREHPAESFTLRKELDELKRKIKEKGYELD